MSEPLDIRQPMEGAEASRRGGIKSIRSLSFSGLLGGYSGASQDKSGRLGENLVKEKDTQENEVADSLADSPDAPKHPNLALSNQPSISKS
ncbi:hypothetical protein O181_056590 [Austropuccinia psidii MF-1]|uniref:Uncharacterized protein n=1 Tax=Austropuccinia psidii MF-1 TaxID=1389203 RepID=A0A9Q3ECY8_9BASI|nr:hypothetical protein [Austropuccinia psidii MF-1]